MYNYMAKVVKVVDGDTIDVEIDLGFDIWHKIRLRLAHIDAYEKSTDIGKEAAEFLKVLLEGFFVEIYTEKTDKYGRYLATVVLNGVNLNDQLISKGYAVPYEGGKR